MRLNMRDVLGTLIHKCRNTVLKAFAARGVIDLAHDSIEPTSVRATSLHKESHGFCRYEQCTLDCMKGVEIAPDGSYDSFECKRR